MRVLVSLLFVVGGIWLVDDGQMMGYACGGFFALGLPVFAFQFHPEAAFLRLEAFVELMESLRQPFD